MTRPPRRPPTLREARARLDGFLTSVEQLPPDAFMAYVARAAAAEERADGDTDAQVGDQRQDRP